MSGMGLVLPQFDASVLQPNLLMWPLLFGLGVYLVLVAQPVGRPKSNLVQRLRRLDVDERIRSELQRRDAGRPIFANSWLESLLRPLLEDVGGVVRSILGRLGITSGRELGRKLSLVRPGMQPMEFIGEKVVAGLILFALFPVLNALDLELFGPWPLWVWLIGWAVGFLGPDWQLEVKLRQRRLRIAMELPTVLDMLTIAASAGLALEQALVEVSRQSEGIVARELQRASREMALGQCTLVEALQSTADRNAVPELSSIVDSLRAVHDQGLPLAHALAAQADALRERQRLRIVEEGGKASIRMVLPVALFIMPVLFVIVLVPADIELTHLGG